MLDKDTKVIQGISTEINGEKRETYINAKYWSGYEKSDIKTIGGQSIFKTDDNDDSNIVINTNSIFECTYSDLKTLRDKSELAQGIQYRITDFITTTTQGDTQSAGKQFDIIVTADRNNSLNDVARVCLHNGDDYFKESNLGAWEIKYCLDNDKYRFFWADPENGKGVIYYMKDEFNNECWYDFKNIQFLRSEKWFNENGFNENENFPIKFDEDKYFYTFSAVDTNGDIFDDSLYSENQHATDNHLGRNVSTIAKLNNTIFIDNKNNGVFNNIIYDGHSNNTFGPNVKCNTIGHDFLDNTICGSFQYNNISSKFTDNKLKGKEYKNNKFKPSFCGNIFNCSLKSCTFGSDNNNFIIDDILSMSNVTIGNGCFNGKENDKIRLNDLYTSNGFDLLSVINDFDEKYEYTILLCDNNKYDIFSHNILDKISNIYDLGSFDSFDAAENASKDANIISNPNINILKYYIPSLNKTGIIEQIVGESSTIQIVTWLGTRKVRTIQFVNNNGNVELTNTTNLEELKILTVNELSNLTSSIDNINISIDNIDPYIYSKPDIEGEIDSYGYIGTLKNIGVSGDLILINSVSVYIGENNNSDNLNKPVFCKLLKFVNDSWEPIYESIGSAIIGDVKEDRLLSFKMKAVDKLNKTININDKIAIVYVDDNGNYGDYVQIKFKSVKTTGSIESGDISYEDDIVIDNNYSPAFVIGYMSMSSESEDDGNIYIGDKTVIKSDEAGELKVFNNNDNTSGFIIRTNDKFDSDIPKLELISTNNTESYKYQFPKLENKDDIGMVVVESMLKDAFGNGNQETQDNERVTAVALNYLNEKLNSINGNITKEFIISITYKELKEMVDDEELTPGLNYRIVDYVTTVSNDMSNSVISAGYRFDIIVTADSKKSLNEVARACFNTSSDDGEYFIDNECNLSAWKIWYCLDNDNERFEWADTKNGKGVIYRMIDEWGNDCPYDFKNIMYCIGDDKLYTFSYKNKNKDYKIFDSSIVLNNGDYNYKRVYDNIIGKYIDDQQKLNEIVFVSEKSKENGYYSNTFGDNCYNNTFGDNCYNNIFGHNCYNNTFGNTCYNIIFGNTCDNNTFGNTCYNNTFGNTCYNNIFGHKCYNNTFGNTCYNNIFGKDNYLEKTCNNNTFGNNCYGNTFLSNCNNNTFGNNCYENTLYSDCYNNVFNNCCESIEFSNIVRSHCFNEVKNLYLGLSGSNKNLKELQNVIILQGDYINHIQSTNSIKDDISGMFVSIDSLGELRTFNLADKLNGI